MAAVNMQDAKTQLSSLARIDLLTDTDCRQLTDANSREIEMFLYNSNLALNK